MRKNRLLCLLYVICAFASNVFAENAKETAEWAKLDERLFFSIKQEQRVDDAGAYEILGRTHFQENRYDRAAFYLKKAIDLNPKLYLSWFYLGLINMNKPEEYLKKSIEINPKFAPSYYWLASYYCRAGRLDESVKYFKKYISAAGNEPMEKDRVIMARGFIEEIKNGEKDYESISKKLMSRGNVPADKKIRDLFNKH